MISSTCVCHLFQGWWIGSMYNNFVFIENTNRKPSKKKKREKLCAVSWSFVTMQFNSIQFNNCYLHTCVQNVVIFHEPFNKVARVGQCRKLVCPCSIFCPMLWKLKFISFWSIVCSLKKYFIFAIDFYFCLFWYMHYCLISIYTWLYRSIYYY